MVYLKLTPSEKQTGLLEAPSCIIKENVFSRITFIKLFIIAIVVFVLVLSFCTTFLRCRNNQDDSTIKSSYSTEPPYRLVCYYNFPRPDDKYTLNSNTIPSHLCTHINLAFGSIIDNKIVLSDYQINITRSINELKLKNSNLKVLLSLGGAGVDTDFSTMVVNHETRKTFIQSILLHVKQHKIDGVDLDWEFPNENTANDHRQKIHFTQLLYEIRKEINRQKKHVFLLTLAVAAPTILVDNSYDVEYINRDADFINVMTYDYHFYTTLTPFTGLNSPLYSRQSEFGYFSTLNINYTTNYWLEKGMDSRKINIGLPTYGHSFKLFNRLNNRIGAPSSGFGDVGDHGFASYGEICAFLIKTRTSPIFDLETQSPFVFNNNEWISFDNEDSLTVKTRFVKENSLGGVMIYALNTDDHSNVCGVSGKRFPLTNAVKNILITT